MAVEERDPVTGQTTTGHEWNGIKELDTPVPRGVLMFLIVTHIWALRLVVPDADLAAGLDLHQGPCSASTRSKIVEQRSRRAPGRSAPPGSTQIETLTYDEILADEGLMRSSSETGHQLFGDNCAACHGARRQGPRQLSGPDRRRLAVGRRPGDDRGDDARRHQLAHTRKPGRADAGLRTRRRCSTATRSATSPPTSTR